jgi:hypothetical protein
MKRFNPWTFGIITLGLFIYLAWNNFDLPFAPWTKTAENEAIIIETGLGYGPKGQGYTQIITISFEVNDSTFIQKKKLSPRTSKKEIGSKVLIEYAVEDPANFKIKGFSK